MVRIESIGQPPSELAGWPLQWKDDPRRSARVLMCGPIEVGELSYRVLAEAGPDAPLTISVDWPAITAHIRSKK